MPEKTHRLVKDPQISARALADYMAGSERAKRTIARDCKFQSRARVVQHDEAKLVVGKFIRSGSTDPGSLTAAAAALRARMADDDFGRDVLDHNADYIDRFAAVFPTCDLALPKGTERLAPGPTGSSIVNGVKVTTEIHARFQRVTKTNQIRVGAAMLRYAKGRPLSSDAAFWQGAFLFGWLNDALNDDNTEVEHKLCVVIDAQSGKCYPAPTDSVSRHHNMKAALASIAERWPNIEPPPGAIF